MKKSWVSCYVCGEFGLFEKPEGHDRQFFKTAKSGNVIYDENARARNGLITTPSHSISALCTTIHRRKNSGLQPLVLNVQR